MRKLQKALSAAALSTVFIASYATSQNAPPVAPASTGAGVGALPAGPGHDTMVRVCSACHAPENAAKQRLSAQGWKDLVDTMANRGAPGSEADFAEITAYLAKNFPDKPVK